MSSSLDAALSSWPVQPWLAIALLASLAIYFRGWNTLRRRNPNRWHAGQLAAFGGGLATLYLALASPIEVFAPLLLQVHMLQHLLLMIVVPPLIWLGDPLLPFLFGLPGEIRRYWAAPLLRWKPLRRIAASITHPIPAWLIFAAATWIWHLPGTYELALNNENVHKLQHACFLMAGLIFWYPVVRPYPAHPRWSLWLLLPYLLLADVQNTLLSAWLAFSDHVLYSHYLAMPRLGGITALDDQSAAGVTMWIPGSIVFLAPLAWIGVNLLRDRSMESGMQNVRKPRNANFPRTLRFDLLRVPVLGSLLRSAWTRRVVQIAVLLVVVTVIVDGLYGPQIGAMNMAGVVPWIHWRGLVIFGLLALGNVFCYGCPFTLPRTIAKWLFPRIGGRTWPRWLQTKWLAVALMAIFLWAYEAFSLWNSPWLTAWIAIAYFVAAFVVDSIFRDATFCKFLCPIGQFNFVNSVISPWQVRVRHPAVCTSCSSHDCLQGNLQTPGCQLQLFQPRKIGNLDCTFCLDCVRACPRDNVGLIAISPVQSLSHDGPRSGIGRLSRRLDYAVLAILLVFGAFANAAGMAAPVVELEDRFTSSLGWSSTLPATTIFYLVVLVALPATCITLAAASSNVLSIAQNGKQPTLRESICHYAWSLVPLGFAMWLAHYSFHFFTSYDTIVPVTQRFAVDFHLGSLGPPDWVCSCCRPAPSWLLKLELLMLDFGLLASLYTLWRMCKSQTADTGPWQTFHRAAAWAILLLSLFAVGVWILLSPMQMRGTLPGG